MGAQPSQWFLHKPGTEFQAFLVCKPATGQYSSPSIHVLLRTSCGMMASLVGPSQNCTGSDPTRTLPGPGTNAGRRKESKCHSGRSKPGRPVRAPCSSVVVTRCTCQKQQTKCLVANFAASQIDCRTWWGWRRGWLLAHGSPDHLKEGLNVVVFLKKLITPDSRLPSDHQKHEPCPGSLNLAVILPPSLSARRFLLRPWP